MQTPLYSPFQFLDAAGFNYAAGAVSGNLALTVSGLNLPGLINPSAVGLSYVGLGVTINAPLPFQVLFGNGAVAAASGIVTNQFTTSYTANVSGLVPASGSVTAYLNVTRVQIQQNPYQVLGPPPGHPDYVPTFVPYTSYLTTNDSLNFIVSTTAPDDYTTFEIGRATLSTGATGVAFATTYQKQVSAHGSQHIIQSSGAVSITAASAGKVHQFTTSGTLTLPLASSVNGMRFTATTIQSSGAVVVNATGSDVIYGWNSTGTAPATTFNLLTGSSLTFSAEDGVWFVQAFSASLVSSNVWGLLDGGAQSANFNAQIGFIYDCDQTAGTFTVNAPTVSVLRGSSFAINSIGTNQLTVNWGGSLRFRGDTNNTIIFPEGLVMFRYSGNAARGWEYSF